MDSEAEYKHLLYACSPEVSKQTIFNDFINAIPLGLKTEHKITLVKEWCKQNEVNISNSKS
jgi:hypothetical protein